MEIRELFRMMLEKKASDLHVRANSAPFVRASGELIPLDVPPVQNEEIEDMAFRLMNPEQQKTFTKHCECDLSVSLEDMGRFRLNIFKQKGTVDIVARCISSDIPTLEKLNLPAVLKTLADNINGLVLVTGPTGSGKSTTLAAMIDYVNSTRGVNIITIEDPIEFVYKDKKSIISQREIGIDTQSYPEALRHVVRQDPDVILIGEIRDTDTMSAALTAAQMGHLVLSTIHTIDTIQTVSREIGRAHV
jgi:twitching motility protein PilT